MFYALSNHHLDHTLALHHTSAANQFPSDPRYSITNQNPAYPSSTSRTSPPIPFDSRTMPVSSQGQYYPQAGDTAQIISGTHIRSQSSTGYPSQYQYGTQPQQAAYYSGADPRSLPPGMSGMHYDPNTGATLARRTSLSVDRQNRLTQHGLPPYARAPPVIPSTYDQESISEPVIKKKRKRAGEFLSLHDVFSY